jgi:hypothetical protein
MTPGQRRIGAIAFNLQDAGKAVEVRFRSLGLFDELRTGLRPAA